MNNKCIKTTFNVELDGNKFPRYDELLINIDATDVICSFIINGVTVSDISISGDGEFCTSTGEHLDAPASLNFYLKSRGCVLHITNKYALTRLQKSNNTPAYITTTSIKYLTALQSINWDGVNGLIYNCIAGDISELALLKNLVYLSVSFNGLYGSYDIFFDSEIECDNLLQSSYHRLTSPLSSFPHKNIYLVAPHSVDDAGFEFVENKRNDSSCGALSSANAIIFKTEADMVRFIIAQSNCAWTTKSRTSKNMICVCNDKPYNNYIAPQEVLDVVSNLKSNMYLNFGDKERTSGTYYSKIQLNSQVL